MDSRDGTTDRKVGGSSPSEHARYPQVRATFSDVGGGLLACRVPCPSQELGDLVIGDLVNLGREGCAGVKVKIALGEPLMRQVN
jgi:hypothetical protein